MQSKNAIGNLINRYKAVLKKCTFLNSFSSLNAKLTLASLCACLALSPLSKAYAFDTGDNDYYRIEQQQAESQYYSTFRLIEQGLAVDYGFLFQNGPNSTQTFYSPQDLANALILEGNPNYSIVSGSAGYHNFDVDIAGQNLAYSITSPSSSSGRIAALTTDLNGAVFYGLHSSNQGGAINVNAVPDLNIDGTFIDNTTATHGGAVSLWGANSSSVDGTFIGNNATTDGGAVSAQVGSTDVISGIFIGNTTERNGGAIYNSGYAKLISGLFIGNTAKLKGGAVFFSAAMTDKIEGTFISNHATEGGALFNADGSQMGSIEASFIGNSAEEWGGAITNRFFIDSISGIFVENTAGQAGGALHNFASTNIIDAAIKSIDASFINNKTTDIGGLGGAIWTNRSLSFQANDRTNVFTGNMDSTGYNAIFVDDTRHDSFLALDFTMLGNGGFVMNDTIRSNGFAFYDVNIEGQDSKQNHFALNNAITGMKSLNVQNASLTLDTFVQGNTISRGSIETKNATFGSDSVLTVNAENHTENAAIQGSGELLVESGATVQISNASVGQAVIVTSGFVNTDSVIEENGWAGENILSSYSLYKAYAVNASPSLYTVAFVHKTNEEIKETYKEMEDGTIDHLQNLAADFDNPLSPNGFFTTLLDNANGLGANNPTLVTTTIEAIMKAAAVGNVSTNAFNLSSISAETIHNFRTTFLNTQGLQLAYLDEEQGQSGMPAGSEQAANKNGLAVWAMPFYSSAQTKDFTAGAFSSGYESSLRGLSLGTDYTFGNNYRLGLAINGGGGSSQSQGDFNETTNDFNFAGLSLYGAMQLNDFTFSADLGYTYISNELEQSLAFVPGYSDASTDFVSHAFTLGTEASYTFEQESFDIKPHIGLRYSHVFSDAYDMKVAGSTMVSTDSEDQGLFSLPVGVTLSKDLSITKDWTFRPSVDLGMSYSFGDLEANATSSIPGITGDASYIVENIDPLAFTGGLGFTLAKEAVSFDVHYDIKASSHETSHAVQARLTYAF